MFRISQWQCLLMSTNSPNPIYSFSFLCSLTRLKALINSKQITLNQECQGASWNFARGCRWLLWVHRSLSSKSYSTGNFKHQLECVPVRTSIKWAWWSRSFVFIRALRRTCDKSEFYESGAQGYVHCIQRRWLKNLGPRIHEFQGQCQSVKAKGH